MHPSKTFQYSSQHRALVVLLDASIIYALKDAHQRKSEAISSCAKASIISRLNNLIKCAASGITKSGRRFICRMLSKQEINVKIRNAAQKPRLHRNMICSIYGRYNEWNEIKIHPGHQINSMRCFSI